MYTFKKWLRQSNEMVDLRTKDPWQKSKTLPLGQTRNKVWIKPSRDVNELKSSP